MGQEPQWSADRQWWWNGQQWVPAADAISQGAQPPPPPPPPTGAPPPPPVTQSAPYVAPALAYATSPQMAPKTSHTGRNIGIGCAGIIGLLILLGIIGSLSNNNTGNPSTPAANNNNAAAVGSSSPSTQPSPVPPKVLLDKKGSGINKTASSTAAGDWEIDYSFDCSNFGSQGNFQVYVFNEDGTPADVPVNDLAAKGQDVSYEHQGGTYYLEINSECTWHVVVKG